MSSIKYDVINKNPEMFGNSVFTEMLRCKQTLTIPVIISPHVFLPFIHAHDAGHMSKGAISD
jgi:hypothetical protein